MHWKLLASFQKDGKYDFLDVETKEVLSEEEKLYEFYEYVEEYQQGFVNISEEEYKYREWDACWFWKWRDS